MVARAEGARTAEREAGSPRAAGMTFSSPRLELAASADPHGTALVERLLGITLRSLPQAYLDHDFAFRLDGTRAADGTWQLAASGTSPRYAAIAALGLMRLPEKAQRDVLAGDTCNDLIGRLAKQLGGMTSLGDVALLCWAAAEAGHADTDRALTRMAELERQERPRYVVDAAWLVSALVAARPQADVEERLSGARRRLLAASGASLYPHTTGGGVPWYRTHVGSFADQVYPLQAFARLHASADDPQALTAAESVADAICAVQGSAGQWWWHYDSRNGSVVEGYPVYSVHQHAMAPMALLDLADAGGACHLQAISRGLTWLAGPPETDENLVVDDPPVTWRKVARKDHRKITRGVRAMSTRIRPEWRLDALDRVFAPGVVDHECRPYELGWLLMTWLS
jgi:hypothetical protein